MQHYIVRMLSNLIISLLHFGLVCQTRTCAAANVIRRDGAEKLQLLCVFTNEIIIK